MGILVLALGILILLMLIQITFGSQVAIMGIMITITNVIMYNYWYAENLLIENKNCAPQAGFIENIGIVKEIQNRILKNRFSMINGPYIIGKTQGVSYYARKQHECAFYETIQSTLDNVIHDFSGTKSMSFENWKKQLLNQAKGGSLRKLARQRCNQIAIIFDLVQKLLLVPKDLKNLLQFGKQVESSSNLRLVLLGSQSFLINTKTFHVNDGIQGRVRQLVVDGNLSKQEIKQVLQRSNIKIQEAVEIKLDNLILKIGSTFKVAKRLIQNSSLLTGKQINNFLDSKFCGNLSPRPSDKLVKFYKRRLRIQENDQDQKLNCECFLRGLEGLINLKKDQSLILPRDCDYSKFLSQNLFIKKAINLESQDDPIVLIKFVSQITQKKFLKYIIEAFINHQSYQIRAGQ